MSMTDIDDAGKSGCFRSAARKIRKRKLSETEENPPKVEKKSIFSTIGEKLGFSREPPRSVLTQNNRFGVSQGELNYSYQHEDCQPFVTNEPEDHPKKRVKFDEDNLIVSSITYQRQQTQVHRLAEQNEEKSVFAKFVNFTANLF